MAKGRKPKSVLTKVPIPEELSDLLIEIIEQSAFHPFIEQRQGKYGILLQPWYNPDNHAFQWANFAVINEDDFNKVNVAVCSIVKDGDRVKSSTKSGGVEMRNYDEKGNKVRKTLHDYPPVYRLIKPPLYCDDDPTGIFTEEIDE